MAHDNTTTHFNLYHDNDSVPRGVETVTVHSTVTSIVEATHSRCSRTIRIVRIPNSVRSIGKSSFIECSSLSTIDIPSSLTHIREHTFRCCFSLKSIIIPNSVISIEDHAFRECSSLSSIDIPNSVRSIGYYAFYNCYSLTAVNLPNSITSIGPRAFYYCSSLSLIVIPQSVSEVGFQSFSECTALEQRVNRRLRKSTTILTWLHRCFHKRPRTWLHRRFHKLPLHQAFYHSSNTMTTTLVENLIQEYSSMLISTDKMLMTPLHVLCCSSTVTARMIQIFKDASPDTTSSMRNVLGETPLMMYLKCKDTKYKACHVNGNLLPLVELLELGIECEVLEIIWILHEPPPSLVEMLEMGIQYDVLEMIFKFYDVTLLLSELGEKNETSGLLPFMYAGSLSQCGLEVTYELAMRNVDLLMDF